MCVSVFDKYLVAGVARDLIHKISRKFILSIILKESDVISIYEKSRTTSGAVVTLFPEFFG